MATTIRKINKSLFQWLSKTNRPYSTGSQHVRIFRRTIVLGCISGTALSVHYLAGKRKNILFSPVLAKEHNDKKEDKEQAMQTAREMRFLSFGSIEYQGNIYMSPLDFLESVTEELPRPRAGRRRLGDDELQYMLKKTPSANKGSPRLFRDLNNKGLISYTEYLFLLCVLTKPHSGFHIAFNMFDTDGNQRVDKKEFLVLVETIQHSTKQSANKQSEADAQSSNKVNIWQKLQSQMLEEILTTTGTTERKPMDSGSPLIIGARERGEGSDTTLSVHFFGRKGKDTLKYEDFHRFMDNLQSEVLELEFMEFSRGLPTISEDEFARVLLRYTTLSKEDYAIYLDRMRSRIDECKGISFMEFKDFGQFLNNLDDFALAMKMYSLLEQPITEEAFKRATKAVTGITLTDHTVHVVFQLFDCDGDGQLSQEEFISVMKDRLYRGFRTQIFSLGTWDNFKSCMKTEIKKAMQEG